MLVALHAAYDWRRRVMNLKYPFMTSFSARIDLAFAKLRLHVLAPCDPTTDGRTELNLWHTNPIFFRINYRVIRSLTGTATMSRFLKEQTLKMLSLLTHTDVYMPIETASLSYFAVRN